MGNNSGVGDNDRPALSLMEISMNSVPKPTDGILWFYKSDNDGFWYIENNEDMALQEATGLPVGELVDYEQFEERNGTEIPDYDAEYGELIIIDITQNK